MFEKNFDYKDFLKRLYDKIGDDDITGNAAQVAFYFTFALFPLLLFLLTLFGFVLDGADNLRSQLFNYLRQVMPGSAFDLVRTTLEEVTESASGGKLTFGLLITLYSASAGIDSLRGALNEVYNLEETRSWWKTKMLAVLLTIGFGILILTALGFNFYGEKLLAYLLSIDSRAVLNILEWGTVLVALLLAFAMIYNFTPNHSPFQWKWISPGGIVGVVLWLILSVVFQIYLNYFNTYAKTYGSLGAMIILLLWLYLTAFVLLLGGAINAIFDEKTGVEKEAEDELQVRDEKTGEGKEQRAD